MSRLKKITRNHLQSWKLVTEQAGETTCCANLGHELCFTILVNMSRLKNIERKLLRSALKQVAESERVMQISRQIGDLFLKHLSEYAQAEKYYKQNQNELYL